MKEGSASSKFNSLDGVFGLGDPRLPCAKKSHGKRVTTFAFFRTHATTRSDAAAVVAVLCSSSSPSVSDNAVTGGVITSQKIIYTAAKTSGGAAVKWRSEWKWLSEGDNWSSEQDELT